MKINILGTPYRVRRVKNGQDEFIHIRGGTSYLFWKGDLTCGLKSNSTSVNGAT